MTKAVKLGSHIKEKDPNLDPDNWKDLSGVAGDYPSEYNYKFLKLQNEKVVSKGDSYIVLGRDREHAPTSGYGGKGKPKANSIDIVVGRLSCVSNPEEIKQSPLWVGPDFKNDAARIHISQRTDIDKNFHLPSGKVGNSQSKSGIGIKADSIRIVARSGIKIVSSADSINSMGLQDDEKVGIDLIAGIPYDNVNQDLNKRYGLVKYRDDMQPIPKGVNLVNCITDMGKQLDAITGMISTFASLQMRFNNEMAIHTHFETFNGAPTLPSHELPGPTVNMNMDIFEKTINDLFTFKTEYLKYLQLTYLSTLSAKYINSRYHNLN